MLKWKENGHECELRLVLNGGVWEGPPGREVMARDIVAALQANPEALTPQQWAEVLSALSPSMQDGITDALVERDVIWGTDATRSRAMRNTALLARAERAEQALATVTAERDDARTLTPHYEDDWKALGATVAEVCGVSADDITHVVNAAVNTLRRLRRERDEARGEAGISYAILENYRARVAKLEKVVDSVDGFLTRFLSWDSDGHTPTRRLGDALYVIRHAADALRALDDSDSPVVAGTDSGGLAAAVTATAQPSVEVAESAGSSPARRDRLDLFTPAERAIWDAAQAVDRAGCDVRLTSALNMLHAARGKVADFVDGVRPAPYGHISKADECQIDSPVGVAATEEEPGG